MNFIYARLFSQIRQTETYTKEIYHMKQNWLGTEWKMEKLQENSTTLSAKLLGRSGAVTKGISFIFIRKYSVEIVRTSGYKTVFVFVLEYSTY